MGGKIDRITIGELKQIKKIANMTYREAIPLAQKLRDKHGLTDSETLELLRVAFEF